MIELQKFHKPGAAYKQVKAVNLTLASRDGSDATHSVMVYMSTAGDVSFAIGLPDDYANAWEHHRQTEYSERFGGRAGVNVIGNTLSAASFAKVVADLASVAHNFQVHIRSVTIKKVIRIEVELRSRAGDVNFPSFSKSQALVGIRFGLRWSVNGKMYSANHRDRYDTSDANFADLYPTGEHGGTVVPYSDEAWAAIVNIEQTLEHAAAALKVLAHSDSATSALAAGSAALLAWAPVSADGGAEA